MKDSVVIIKPCQYEIGSNCEQEDQKDKCKDAETLEKFKILHTRIQ